jgi:hypothetical protein
MESAVQESVIVKKEETKWAREYNLRWSKACFLLGMMIGMSSVWNVWRYVPGLEDKVSISLLVLIPASLGDDVWKAEKRGGIKKPMACSFLNMLGLLAMFSGEALGWIYHAARTATAAVEILK